MIKKVFKQMLATQIMSAMTVMICMLIDSIMIGRFLGVDSMTAYGLATPVLLIFAAFGSMLAAGIQVHSGKSMGSGNMEETNAGFSSAVFLAAAVSFVGMAVVIIFVSPICTLLGAGENTPDNPVFGLTRDYIIGFIVGAPAFIFAQIMVPYMQISGNRTRLVVAVAAMTVADVTFDILNVFVFKGGTLGMGLASSISYYIAFIIGAVYFFKKKCIFKFRRKLVKAKCTLGLLKYGVPTVINQLCLVLLVFVLNKILLEVGQNSAVAAYSVISTVGNICYCFGSGVASVALLMSAIFYSDEDRTELRSLVKTMVFYSIVLDVIVIAVVLAAAPLLVNLFLADEPGAYDMAVLGVRLFSLSLLPCALNTSLKNYYQGVNRAGLTKLISILQNLALPALFAFILSRFAGTTGVWLGFVCGETLTLLIISVLVWIKNGKISFSPDAYALLPADFGAKEGEYMEVSLDSVSGAVDASKAAERFCSERGEDARTCYFIALCIEEMANNIVLHGFTKGGKGHSVDIRLTFKNGRRVIRIRDDCVNFDPVKYIELHSDDDPIAHIGIRMVMKMVKSANYVNSLGLNNLTLVL
ncbi:MAG: ATP-binding protein [Clostridia bacterium]|nr:ATP-binding protein [Clostridia bacterium]